MRHAIKILLQKLCYTKAATTVKIAYKQFKFTLRRVHHWEKQYYTIHTDAANQKQETCNHSKEIHYEN